MAMNQNPFAVGVPANLNNPTGPRATIGAATGKQLQQPTLQQQQQGAQLLEQEFAAALQQQRQQQPTLTLQQQLNQPTLQQQLNQPVQQSMQQPAPTLQQIGYAPSGSRGATTSRGRSGILGRQMGYRKF